MAAPFSIFALLLYLLMTGTIGSNHFPTMHQNKKDRLPVVAGQFYPAKPEELKRTLEDLFKQAVSDQTNLKVRGLLVPHAGYVYSGGVAASGYNQLHPDQAYEHVFIIASSHRTTFGKASVYNQGDYITPLGRVEVDLDLANRLIAQKKAFTFEPSAHAQEHSIEVQLPFLQYHLTKPFKLVPIVLGTHVPSVCQEIAGQLKPYFTEKNLFIISADFSHYPAYDQAVSVDKATADAFCTNRPDLFLEVLERNERLRIPDLATSMCAWPAALTLLYLTEKNPNLQYNAIQYRNSGDIRPYGDKSSVVGYHAMVLTDRTGIDIAKKTDFLTDQEKDILLKIARSTLESYVRTGKVAQTNNSGLTPGLKKPMGAFVTLKCGDRLRGCIGSFEPTEPVWKVVESMTISSAMHDSRFVPVQIKELSGIHIEISVLTPLRKITDYKEIELGKHGIYIKQGNQSGTFLPQVATETGWTLEEFLGHCAQDKAGLGWEGWKKADLFVYEAIVFEEEE